ncbi:hypothetical protein N7463_000334 [Penicillium fimorum]|uniref:Uncharacterized protein n=1 Tax=Penicillium fimorum TaxID=1882269 RepID=A0A9X0CAU1_9EURO|nr:hypothetical protein N7463_000334 [Penicillium fimorum]
MEDELNFLVEETADIVGMVQPWSNVLVQGQVFPVARRLVAGDVIKSRRRLARKDFAMLISILIRLRLHVSAPFGSFEKVDANGRLPTILTDSIGGQDRNYLEFDQAISILYLLPPMPEYCKRQPHIPNGIPDQVLSAISLFVPQPITVLSKPTEEERWISLESIKASPNDEIPTVADIAHACTSDPRLHVVLITSKDT